MFLNITFFILQGAQTGKDNGYTILLDIESFDYEFFKEGSEGLKVALVHHLVKKIRIFLRFLKFVIVLYISTRASE